MANPGPSTSELPPHGEHTVRRGETLGILATRYGMSVAELAEANDILDVDLIVIGRELHIPGPVAVAAPAAGRPEATPEENASREPGSSRVESDRAATAEETDPSAGPSGSGESDPGVVDRGPVASTRDVPSEPAVATTFAAAGADPHPGLTQLEMLYRDARFEEALAGSHGPAVVDTRDARARARLELLRGKLATAFGRSDEARGHFARARALDPALALPADGSPKVAALFRAAGETARP